MNTQNPAPGSAEAAKQQFAKEIAELEKKAFEKGRASASSVGGAGVAERLAAKARDLQAANPKMSNIDAVRAAYQAEGIPLE